jgi:hypothetical protein
LQQNWPPEHGVQLGPHGPSQPALLAGPHPFTHWPLQQWKPGALLTAQSRQLTPHRVESVFGSAEQRVVLPSHCTGLSAGHVQKPVDPLHTLSPGQGEGVHVMPPVHIELTQVWLGPHGLLQPPQCWLLLVVLVSQFPSPLQSAVPDAQDTPHCPGATHATCEAQYAVPAGQGRHFFFFLHRVAQQSLSSRQRLAPGSTQAAALTSSARISPLAT